MNKITKIMACAFAMLNSVNATDTDINNENPSFVCMNNNIPVAFMDKILIGNVASYKETVADFKDRLTREHNMKVPEGFELKLYLNCTEMNNKSLLESFTDIQKTNFLFAIIMKSA